MKNVTQLKMKTPTRAGRGELQPQNLAVARPGESFLLSRILISYRGMTDTYSMVQRLCGITLLEAFA